MNTLTMDLLGTGELKVKRTRKGKTDSNPMPVAARERERNGVKAPQRDGACKAAWDLFDAAPEPVYSAQLQDIAEATGLNVENLRIELRRWRKFNGMPKLGRMQVTH